MWVTKLLKKVIGNKVLGMEEVFWFKKTDFSSKFETKLLDKGKYRRF